MNVTTESKVRELLQAFISLPWRTPKPKFQAQDAPETAYVMADLGFHQDDYAEFLQEFAVEFDMPAGPTLAPKDETIASLSLVAETRRWPEAWGSG
ncbi:MAG TPA: hypothetical protein VG841_06630 [Caulobacterales bacterium]|nr:hypothetical protein [Caulobacterales bacterium]